jgi:MtaA/CmuA family methyltransferase
MDKISQVISRRLDSAVFPLVCADHCAHLLNVPFSEVAANGSRLAEVLAYGYDQYKYDMVLVFSDPYVEAQALGCPVRLNPYPTLQGARANIKVDRTPAILKAAEILKRDLDAPVYVSIKGAFSLAAFLGGVENFLRIIIKKESEAEKFLEQAMEFLGNYLNSILALGVNVFIGDPLASSSVVSPSVFRKYALEPLRNLVARIKGQGVVAGVHICGDTRPIIDSLDRIGADILSVENIMVRTKTLLMGGVRTQTILNGHTTSIESEARDALAMAPLILSTSCDVPPQTKPKSILTMLRVARDNYET